MPFDPSDSPASRDHLGDVPPDVHGAPNCASDQELLKLWQGRLRTVLGDVAASAVDLHFSNGRLFLCPRAGSASIDGCMASLLASCPDWDMVVLLPAGSDPRLLRAASTGAHVDALPCNGG